MPEKGEKEMAKRKIAKYRCEIFKCKGSNPCCFYCKHQSQCKSVCLNSPDRCGKLLFASTQEKGD